MSIDNAGCPEGWFRCALGECIPQSWMCDGVDNCGDRSDEDNTECGEL